MHNVTIDDVHVGDILRVNNDSHSVVILEVHPKYVVLAEGNFNSSIHWGRRMTAQQVANASYLMTRYPVGTFGSDPFKDVSMFAYYYEPIMWALEKEITKGTTDTTFSPNDSCTRAQAVTFLWRANGSPAPTKEENPFMDVSEEYYYYQAVLWAVEKGITNGTGETTFSPDATCTRGQIVTFQWRAAGEPEPTVSSNPFADVHAEDYYFNPVLWAVENGITNGETLETFAPLSSCTRGHIVTFLYRGQKD